MKKVFLSLAMVAALTVISCKETKTETEETTVVPTEEVTPMEETAPVAADTTVVAPTEATPEAAPAQ